MTTTDKKTTTPKGFERILAGALKLPLQQRATIATKMTEANRLELADMEKKLKDGQAAVANGLPT